MISSSSNPALPLPVILLSRLWINRWQAGHRGAHDSNICVALVYGASSAQALDLRPRKPGRRELSDLLFPAVLSVPMPNGTLATPRRDDTKLGISSGGVEHGVRVETLLFELKMSMNERLDTQTMAPLARAFEVRMALTLEPLLGAPLLTRAQWGEEGPGYFATGGDPGLMPVGQRPVGAPNSVSTDDAWSALLRQIPALDQARQLKEATERPESAPQTARKLRV